MKLIPKITRHPRLDNAVEFEVLKEGFSVEHGVSVKKTIEDAVADAKRRIMHIFPSITLEDFSEQL